MQNISVELARNYPQAWMLALRTADNVSCSYAPLDHASFAKLVEQLNAASAAGAPWPKLLMTE